MKSRKSGKKNKRMIECQFVICLSAISFFRASHQVNTCHSKDQIDFHIVSLSRTKQQTKRRSNNLMTVVDLCNRLFDIFHIQPCKYGIIIQVYINLWKTIMYTLLVYDARCWDQDFGKNFLSRFFTKYNFRWSSACWLTCNFFTQLIS
jgi:hypothetical protein